MLKYLNDTIHIPDNPKHRQAKPGGVINKTVLTIPKQIKLRTQGQKLVIKSTNQSRRLQPRLLAALLQPWVCT